MVTKVYIVDKDKELVSKISQVIAGSQSFESVGSSTNFKSAVKDIKAIVPDIVVSGINLGNDFSAWHLSEEVSNPYPNYVFLSPTDDEQQYLRSRKVKGSKFLVKPFGMQSLRGMLEEIHDKNLRLSVKLHAKDNMLFIKKDKSFKRINLADILYFFSEGNYVTLHTPDQNFVFKYALSKLLNLDRFSDFIRVHRSYAVNSLLVNEVNLAGKYLMVRQEKIPFGRTFTQDVRKIMNLGLK